MLDDKLLALMKNTGVLMEGHFLLTSGRHGDRFLQCSQLLQYPEYTAEICKLIAKPFENSNITAVIGPAMGGVILAYETARALKARALYAEPVDGKMDLRRGFKLFENDRVLVVEDAVTTGGSVQKVLDLLEKLNADVIGVSVFINRSGGKIDFGLPSYSLIKMNIDSYDPETCPLCKAGVPLQKPKN